ncbi:hypothetical protein SOD_c42350 [Serratia plymuthica 4Rx13]|uniref:Integrase n=1 Tax=Serratia plymuthica TaxID=82996 RepID=A0A318P8I7_SERPL|nr:site-specific integrase [Serratia plymuthica]AGO57184.1 hypothetical protein SOD_c42350 [Serratia plymuthica 4Rx13]PYD38363.1 integrase [Serratia plymuthica]
MAENKLTDVKLRALLKAEINKPTTLADGLGLSIRVTPSQKKTAKDGKREANNLLWLFRYRNLHKSPNPLTLVLGRYPDLTLLAARAQREQCRQWLVNNLDPKDQYKLSAADTLRPITVREALTYWIDNYARDNRANVDKHIAQLEKHIYPRIGSMPLSLCHKGEWLGCFDQIKKTSPVASGYIFQMCKQALKFCRIRGYAESHALDDLTIAYVGEKQNRKDRVLNDDELSQLWSAISGEVFLPYYSRLLLLLVVFGCRSQEVRLSEWSEWDLQRWVWTVPKEHSKGGIKILRPVPEGVRPFIECLHKQYKESGFLLGESKDSSAVSQTGRLIWKRLNHADPWTLHDIRRTFATKLNDQGVAPHVVEQLLGHALPGIMAVYNHSQYMPEKLTALNAWYRSLNSLHKI